MAKVISTLAYQITMDYSKFQEGAIATRKELSAARRVIEETRTPVEKLQVATEGLGKMLASGAIDADTHSRALKQLQSEFASVDKEILGAVPGLEKFQELLTPEGAGLAAVTAAVAAVTGAISLLKTGVEEVIEAGKRIDELGDKSMKLGIDPESLSLLTMMGDFADVGADKVEAGIQKMLTSVGKAAGGNTKLGETFQALELDAAKLIQLDIPDMMSTIFDAIGNVPTNAQQVAIFGEVFGKGNLELRNMVGHMDELKMKAESTGSVITQDQVDVIADADEALKEFTHTVNGLSNDIATHFAPVLTEVMETLTSILQTPDDLRNIVDIVGALAEVGGVAFGDFSHSTALKKGILEAIDEREKRQIDRDLASYFPKGSQERKNLLHIDAWKEGFVDEDDEDVIGMSGAKKMSADEKRLAREAAARQDYLDDLREEVALIGKSKGEADVYKAIRKGLSGDMLEEVKTLAAQHDEMEKQKKAAEELTRATKETERHAEQIAKALQVKATKALDDLLTKPQKVAKELAAIRDQLTDSQFEAVLNAEAKALVGKSNEPQFAGAALRGSQEDIASRARQTAEQSRNDSKRFEQMVEYLRTIAKHAEKGPIEINSVSVGGL